LRINAAIAGLEIIKGVLTHKRHPNSRKTVKFYVAQVRQFRSAGTVTI